MDRTPIVAKLNWKTIKDTWTKSRRGWRRGREVGLAGVGWRDGEKMQTTVIE